MQRRKRIPQAIKKNINLKNKGVCCVCKERGLGLNFHHLDENNANNDEENIALLCVKEHDQFHRPNAYDKAKHLDLGVEKIRELKRQWEKVVEEAESDTPKIIAVVNGYGTYDSIHSVRLLVQDIDGKIIYQRLYHLLTGTLDQWTDRIIEEVSWLGKNVKLSIINKPLQVERCPCCSNSLSTVLDKNVALHYTSKDWKKASIGSIYINPKSPSVAFNLSYHLETIYMAHLHKCNGFLHFMSDKYEERTPIIQKVSIRTQAQQLFQKVINTWEPGQIFIGTGDPENPTITQNFVLPKIWEGNANINYHK